MIIGVVGFWTRSLVEGTLKAELATRLQTVLAADVAALRLWCSEKQHDARSYAGDLRIGGSILDLATLEADRESGAAALASAGAGRNLRVFLRPMVDSGHYSGYAVVAPDGTVLASSTDGEIGRPAPPEFEAFLRRPMEGQAMVSRPFLHDPVPGGTNPVPVMFVAAPVIDGRGRVAAVLGLSMRPEGDFSAIFSVAPLGETGEAYAFDRAGDLLTSSRFDGELRLIRLIPNRPGVSAIMRLRLLDPGVDLQRGERPAKPRSQWPLTRLALSGTRGSEGADLEGYRDYRGAKVIGAWTWVPEYSLGVATELGVDEAFEALYILRRAFLALFFLLATAGLGVFGFSLLVNRLQATMRRDVLAAGRLGQYVLLQEVGRGANGIVYRARHTLLRRPVAIKLLSPEMATDAAATRFEHEVQMTSQLTHPNTVAIYDYGRSPEGLFYYAMEYLNGISLDRLVREYGPQPEARVIHILRQVLGSLAEAHRIGLIHRDIKPANILLTRRGGVCDWVKVLDFGLVKAVWLGPRGVAADAVVGTPHFISPEGVESPENVDVRSDLYSVAAVGYWLVTGKTLFDPDNVQELFDHQVRVEPPPPSVRLGRAVAPDLEEVLMRGLTKTRAGRPTSATEFEEALSRCRDAGGWSAHDAAAWWSDRLAGLETMPAATMAEKTLVIAPRRAGE